MQFLSNHEELSDVVAIGVKVWTLTCSLWITNVSLLCWIRTTPSFFVLVHSSFLCGWTWISFRFGIFALVGGSVLDMLGRWRHIHRSLGRSVGWGGWGWVTGYIINCVGWICLEDDTTCTHPFEDLAHTLLKKVVSIGFLPWNSWK